MAAPFRMLLAVDLSLASSQALQPALRLAKRLDAHVILVHAHLQPSPAPTLTSAVARGPYVPYIEAEAQLQANATHELAQRWGQRLRDEGISIEVIARPGRAEEVILDVADEFDVDLIVLGRHGMGRLRRLIMGSVTKAVIERTTRPITIIPIKE